MLQTFNTQTTKILLLLQLLHMISKLLYSKFITKDMTQIFFFLQYTNYEDISMEHNKLHNK